MTIKKLAEELKVSPQAIYQRLKSNDVDVKKLVDSKTKELTEDGEYTIRKLFSREDGEPKPTKQSMIEEFTRQIEDLRKENTELVEKLKAAEKRISELEKDRDVYATALEKSQSIQEQMMNRFLPAAGQTVTDSDRLTWKERFTGRRNKAKA